MDRGTVTAENSHWTTQEIATERKGMMEIAQLPSMRWAGLSIHIETKVQYQHHVARGKRRSEIRTVVCNRIIPNEIHHDSYKRESGHYGTIWRRW